jgi:hypothetical protein
LETIAATIHQDLFKLSGPFRHCCMTPHNPWPRSAEWAQQKGRRAINLRLWWRSRKDLVRNFDRPDMNAWIVEELHRPFPRVVGAHQSPL